MEINIELQSTCASLGYLEKEVYYKEPDCLAAIRDLIRFLRREEESCDIRRQLGQYQLVQKDLIPIIKQYADDKTLLDNTIRLMVNLTQPAVLCFNGVIPEEKGMRTQYLEIERYLQDYKQAFVDEALVSIFTRKLGELLALDWENRSEDDRLLLERMLLLIRNLLHVPTDPEAEQRTDDDANIHDQLLWTMHVTGLEDILIYVASSESERQFAFHILEIISLMLREQTAEHLAVAGEDRSVSEKEKDNRELERLRQQELAKKREAFLKRAPRHSRFGGTYVLGNVKSISDRNQIYHNTITRINERDTDIKKNPKKRPKNRQIQKGDVLVRRSTLSVRIFLKQFCVQIIENCYNPLMRAVKGSIIRSATQENDETYYLWAIRFFMEFQRLYKFRIELISETLSVPTFHYVQTQLQTYHDMRMSNKKEGIIWSKRLHLAIRAYLELLNCLASLDHSKDPKLRSSSKVIKANVFYMIEYREIFVTLLRNFDETRQSRAYLRDLVEATHLFCKLLEGMSKSNTHLVVQKKKKQRAKKPKAPVNNNTVNTARAAPAPPDQSVLEDTWDNISPVLSAMIQGNQPIDTQSQDVSPFDAASDVNIDDQKVDAMLRIQRHMRAERVGDALTLMRAAREVWPEDGEFGAVDISNEDEFMSLRQIHFTELPGSERLAPVVTEGGEGAEEAEGGGEEQGEPSEDEEENEELAETITMDEGEFNFVDYVKRFAHPQALRACITLLGEYKHNTPHTNHCVIKILHRVATQCYMVGMLMQLRLFRVFQKVMLDPVAKTKQYDEILCFAKYLLRQFFKISQNNSIAFVELLFWKNNRESYELMEGYGTHQAKDRQSGRKVWTEDQEIELRRLYDEYKDNTEEGMDVVDHIVARFSDQRKTRRMILRQLVMMDVIHSAKEIKKQNKSKRLGQFIWTEEDEAELKTLYEENKDSENPLMMIVSGLTVRRPKARVIEKLLALELIGNDSPMLPKRRRRKPRADDGEGAGAADGGRAKGKGNSCWENTGRPDDFIDTTDDSSSDDEPPAGDASGGGAAGGASTSQVPRYLKLVLETPERVNAVKWIKANLISAAEDKEEDEDDDEAMPLVPVSEEQEDAMEDEQFRNLLTALGVKAPANEQERYWRIPAYLSAHTLRERSALLDRRDFSDLDEKQERQQQRNEQLAQMAERRGLLSRHTQSDTSSSSSDSDGDLDNFFNQHKSSQQTSSPTPSRSNSRSQRGRGAQRRSGATQQRRRRRQPSSSSSDSSVRSSSPSLSGSRSPSTRSHTSTPARSASGSQAAKRHITSDSDGSSDASDTEQLQLRLDTEDTANNSQQRQQQRKPRKRVRVAESEDDDDDGVADKFGDGDKSDDEDADVQRNSTELESFPATMYTQTGDDSSDDSDDDHIPLRRAAKRPAVIDSDSD